MMMRLLYMSDLLCTRFLIVGLSTQAWGLLAQTVYSSSASQHYEHHMKFVAVHYPRRRNMRFR